MTTPNELKVNFVAHTTYGIIFSTFGPLIPFLSEQTNRPEFEFNYIFAMRGVAYVLAGITQKTILSKYNLQLRMQIAIIFGGIFFILFLYAATNPTALFFVSFVLNYFFGSIQILVNVIMTRYGKNNIKYYASLSYGIYGLGGMIGPILVAVLGLNALIYIGIWMIILGFIYFIVPKTTPEELEEKINQENILEQENQCTNMEDNSKIMSKTSQYGFYALFLLYASISLTYRSWEPSFIFMEGIATKQNAAWAISTYSIFLTAFRFVFLYVKTDTEKLLKLVSYLLLVLIFISTLLVKIYPMFLLLGTPIFMGILYSSYIPLLYSIPNFYKKQLSEDSTTNTIIAYALGQVVICALVGYMMQITPMMLFYSLIFMAFTNIFVLNFTMKTLHSEKGSFQESKLKEENEMNEIKQEKLQSINNVKEIHEVKDEKHEIMKEMKNTKE